MSRTYYLPDTQRILPQSPDAEKGVLSSILLDADYSLVLCRDKGISHKSFHIPANAIIFRAMMDIWADSKPVDIVILTQVLSSKKLLDQAGGPAYITELLSFVPTARTIDHYIDILREMAVKRFAIAAAEEIKGLGYNGDDLETISEAAQRGLASIIEASEGREPQKTNREHVLDIFMRLDEARTAREDSGKDNLRGIPSGITGLDEVTGGMHDTAYIAIMAQKTQGKTALGLTMLLDVVINQGKPAGVFSLEMSTPELLERLISSRAGVNLARIVNGNLTIDQEHEVLDAGNEIARAPIFIEDQPGLSIMELCAKARRMKAENKIELLMVDYIQLVKGLGKRREESKTDEVTDVSRILKQLQKELGIPILVLCQSSEDGKVKWAGAVEEDANLAIRIEHRNDGSWLRIVKQRSGKRNIDVPVYFDLENVRFKDRVIEDEPEEQHKPKARSRHREN